MTASLVSNFRAIDVTGLAPVAIPKLGRAPKLEWLSLSSLIIDAAYQRDISPLGERNIRKIAADFSWAAFSPILVAPAGIVGRYAIIDGQHRAHAAKLIGLDRLPCQIVDIAVADQARAFARVNDNVTRIHSSARFHALLAAGDERAVAIKSIADEAGVTILRYPVSSANAKPRQTNVAWPLEKLAGIHGRECVVIALRAIVETAKPDNIHPNNAGLLSLDMIHGLTIAISRLKGYEPAALIEAFRSFDIGRLKPSSGLGQGVRAGAIADAAERRLRRVLPATPVSQPRIVHASSATVERKGVTLPRLRVLETEEPRT